MRNRQADDQNDVGWGILPGNFQRHLSQIDPEKNSIGWWNVGPAKHPYGLFARSFETASGRTAMTFRLADGFFAQTTSPQAVKLRVVYLDRGQGGWQLVYANPQGEKVASTVVLKNTGKWQELQVTLSDAVWNHHLAGGGDLALRLSGGGDTVFHLLELERQ